MQVILLEKVVNVGDFPLTVALHTDVTANIKVSVLGDTTGVAPA